MTRFAAIAELRARGRVVEAHDAAMGRLQASGPEEGAEWRDALDALRRVYRQESFEWARPYTFPARDVIALAEVHAGTPPLASAFGRGGRSLAASGRTEEAFQTWVSALVVYAEFGCTGFGRRSALFATAELALELGHLEAALAAATSFSALTEPEDVLAESGESMVAIALFRLGRASDAVPHFARAVAMRRQMDANGNRRAWVHEAEEWLERARAPRREGE